MDLMNCILKPMLDQYVTIFINDILVYSKSLEVHVVHLTQVLETLLRHHLYAKFCKCSV